MMNNMADAKIILDILKVFLSGIAVIFVPLIFYVLKSEARKNQIEVKEWTTEEVKKLYAVLTLQKESWEQRFGDMKDTQKNLEYSNGITQNEIKHMNEKMEIVSVSVKDIAKSLQEQTLILSKLRKD